MLQIEKLPTADIWDIGCPIGENQITKGFILQPSLIKFERAGGFYRPISIFQKNGKMIRVTPTSHPLLHIVLVFHHLLTDQKPVKAFSHTPIPTPIFMPRWLHFNRFNVKLVSLNEILSKLFCMKVRASIWPPYLRLFQRKIKIPTNNNQITKK